MMLYGLMYFLYVLIVIGTFVSVFIPLPYGKKIKKNK